MEEIRSVQIPEGKDPLGMVLVCQASSKNMVPTCNDTARAYAESFGSSAPFPFATVVATGIFEDAKCMQFFSNDGTPVQ